jgi:hypothetical protein
MITSDFAALNETVQFGTKIHTEAKRWEKDRVFGDLENKEKYVDEIINYSETDESERAWARETYNWDNVINQWHLVLKGLKK